MTGGIIDFIWLLVVLFILPLDLWVLSLLLERVNVFKEILIHPAICSLNFAYAYLSIDVMVSVATCLSLYYLTYTGDPAAFSPSAWLVRWGGIVLIIVLYALQFPIETIVKLLWPILRRHKRLPDWVRRLNGIPRAKTLKDLLSPWSKGMRDTAHWVGLCVLGGAVAPYLGVLTVSWLLTLFRTELTLSKMANIVFDLLLVLSDWGGAFVILTLMLNLLSLSFSTCWYGKLFSGQEM